MYIYIYTYVCIYIYIYVHIYIYVCMYMYLNTSKSISIFCISIIFIYIYIYLYICNVCIDVCMYVYIYVCMYVRIWRRHTVLIQFWWACWPTNWGSVSNLLADYSSLLGGSLNVAAKGSVKVTYKCAENDWNRLK